MIYSVEITKDSSLISDPESEDAKVMNIALNILGGLQGEDLSDREKELCKKYGYYGPYDHNPDEDEID